MLCEAHLHHICKILLSLVSELFNTKWTIFHLYHSENKLIFDVMFKINTPYKFLVLSHNAD